ncbi:MAG: PTS sugar transporter subunit IIB [Lachnospiraceae bacterium]|jgi:mannose/fructose/N-acetylgalactosamine-specific phosphotransferase system component IIB|nr:PTS sugar transporter subunit IIB [Lachnospiraceae bacterium]
MKNMVLIRIDDRLIHGQVVTQWIKDTAGNRILIVDDKLVNDRLMQRILKAAAPPGVKVEVMTVADAGEELKKDPLPGENIVILVKIPQVLEALIDDGIPMKKIVLGGMGLTPARKKFNRNVAASEEEVACMKRIVAKGVTMEYQLVPAERATNVEKLF